MLFECIASCTGCMVLRRERKGVDVEEDPAAVRAPTPMSVPMSVPVPAQQAPETASLGPLREPLRANDDGNGPAPDQVYLGFFTSKGRPQNIRVTIDHSKPVNLVTDRCVRRLGYEPLTRPPPAALRELASTTFPANFAWQHLRLYTPRGHNGTARSTNFVVVGDHDLACDMLLGREFEGTSFEPVDGIYPLYPDRRTPAQIEEARKKKAEKDAREAEAAKKRKNESAERNEQSRKENPDSGEGNAA